MRKRNKSYIYFFVAALLLQLIALLQKFMGTETVLELKLYDNTYFVDEFILIQVVTIIYFLLGLGYWLLYKRRRRPNKTLATIHTVVTVGSLIFYLVGGPFGGLFDEQDSFTNYYEHNETLIMLLLPPIAIAQLLYIINMYIGIQTPYHTYRNKKKEY